MVFYEICQLVLDDKMTRDLFFFLFALRGLFWRGSTHTQKTVSQLSYTDGNKVLHNSIESKKKKNGCLFFSFKVHNNKMRKRFSPRCLLPFHHSFCLIDERRNSPLEVERSYCSTKDISLPLHTFDVQNTILLHRYGNCCSLPAP